MRRLWFQLALIPPVTVVLWAFSFPDPHPIFVPVVLFVLGPAALVRLVLWLLQVARDDGDGRSEHGRWLIGSVVAWIVVLILLFSSAPLRARWALSQPAFEAVAQQALRDGSPVRPWETLEPRRIGLYEVETIWSDGETVLFRVGGDGSGDLAGFTFLAAAGRARSPAPEDRHLGGPWYGWIASPQ